MQAVRGLGTNEKEHMAPPTIPSPFIVSLPEEDDEFRKSYRSLVSSSLRTSFPSFVRNYEIQKGLIAERRRVAMIDFDENGKTSITQFTSTAELRSFFDKDEPSTYIPRQPPRKRLYLLEDIARNNVEVLGSRLRIPPSVFAAHWADPATSRGTYDDASLVSRGPHYFRLRFPQVHRVDGEYPLGLYGDRNSNVPRWLQLLDEGRLFESSEHHFSFWGTVYGERSWIGRSSLKTLG